LFSEGLPNVVVTDLEIYYDSDPANSKLRAATYGRGVWESDLYEAAVVNNISFNTDPIVLNDATEDANYTGSISGFIDYSGQNDLTYLKTSGPSWLTVNAATGAVSGIPANEDTGPNTFVVKVDAGTDGNDQAELKIFVINSNDSPVFNADPIIGDDANEGSAYSGSVAGFASDQDGDALSFMKLSGPAWLLISPDGTLGGTPGINDHDLNQWTIQVSDGNGGTDSSVLKIFVYPVNHPPVFNSDPVIKADASEDAAYSSSLLTDATDPDDDNLSFSKLTGPTWLDVNQDGTLSGNPVQSDVGLNSFSIRVTDGVGGADEATLNIEVVNVNDAPVFAGDHVTLPDAPVEQPVTGSLAELATDEDGDQLTFSIAGPDWLSCSSSGDLSGTPAATDIGTNAWTVTVSDGAASDNAILSIDVLFVNHPPEFTSDPIDGGTVLEDISISGSISSGATDIDGDPLNFSKVTGPSWLTVEADGTLSGTPAQANVGQNSFTVRVSDGTDSDDATLNIVVENTNDAPVFANETIILPDATIGEFYENTLAGEATDEDNDQLSYSVSGPLWLNLNDPSGTFSGLPLSGDTGINYWTVTVTDGNGGIATATLQINVVAAALYCDPGAWNNSSEYINSVVFNGLASSTGPDAGGYGNHSDLSFQFDVNSTVNFTLSPGFAVRASFVYWNIWIDYNKDGSFEGSNELVYSATKKRNDVSDILNIGDTPMKTRMRISVSDSDGALGCGDSRNGEVEDYTVEIQTAGPKPPSTDFLADQTSITPGTTVYFTDLSSDNPYSWQWTFGNGESSTLQNPSAIYNSVGVFSVTLTATNDYGSNTLTRDAYIVVSDNTGGDYCEPAGIDNSTDYINSVNIDGISNSSGQGETGYYHFLSPVFNIAAGNQVSVALDPFDSKNRNFWRIWIDFNGDGDFDDSDETLLAGNNKKGTYADYINIPSYVQPGITRMRITMQTGSSPASCDDGFSGEVEDYDVNIIAGGIIGLRDPGQNAEPAWDLKIFPNPVKDILNVQTSLVESGASLRIYSLLGREMLWLPVLSDYTEIDIVTFEKGLYFLVYESGGRMQVRKFVKN
jgi:PKD repeat protein